MKYNHEIISKLDNEHVNGLAESRRDRRKIVGNVRIAINTDNAAFQNGPDGELVRILRDIADCIEAGVEVVVRDINGNTVGKVEF